MSNPIPCAKCGKALSEKELAQGYCSSCRAKEEAQKRIQLEKKNDESRKRRWEKIKKAFKEGLFNE